METSPESFHPNAMSNVPQSSAPSVPIASVTPLKRFVENLREKYATTVPKSPPTDTTPVDLRIPQPPILHPVMTTSTTTSNAPVIHNDTPVDTIPLSSSTKQSPVFTPMASSIHPSAPRTTEPLSVQTARTS